MPRTTPPARAGHARRSAGIDTLADRIRGSREALAAAVGGQSAATAGTAGTISVITEKAQLASSQAMEGHHAGILVQARTMVLRGLIESS